MPLTEEEKLVWLGLIDSISDETFDGSGNFQNEDGIPIESEDGGPLAGIRVHEQPGVSFDGIAVPAGTTEVFGKRIELSERSPIPASEAIDIQPVTDPPISGDFGQAGGDGTGVGDPGWDAATTHNAVSELGMDPAGGTPINSALKDALADDTEIIFPGGTYLVNPEGDTGIVIYEDQFWLKGGGQTRDDVRFVLPDNTSAGMFNFAGNTAVSNLVWDQSTSRNNWIQNAATGAANTYAYNVATVGRSPIQANLPGPLTDSNVGNATWSVGMDAGATFRLQNYRYTDPEWTIVDYPGNTLGVQAPRGHEGVFEAVNCWFANRGEHNIYASRCIGDTRIVGGYYHNSVNTNLRFSGAGSYVNGATIHVDMPQSRQIEADTGDPKAVRGLRVETGSYGKTGGLAQNCDFIYTTQQGGGSTECIEIDGVPGFTVKNCRFRHDNDADGLANVNAANCVFVGCSFTGSSSRAAVNGAGDTEVRDSCISMPDRDGFPGCVTSNISYDNCPAPSV